MARDNNKVDSYLESTTTKYMIYADFKIDGVVEKPDVVGALFGQTEGLLSDDLDLRELQKSGRVGRIKVSLRVRSGKTNGYLSIPSSLDKVETSILAAAIETVDRIGPCNAQLKITKIDDVREEKRRQIIERASTFLKKWDSEVSPESSELHDEVLKKAQVGGVSQFANLPAGPEIQDSETLIIVEGRADIIACLRAGIGNTIAVEGANIPRAVSNLTKKKSAIAFLDGDRGGDLILKTLLMYADIDYIARAPKGKEVEDLKPKEIVEQLSKKVPLEHASFISEIHANNILRRAIQRKKERNGKIKRRPQPTKPQVAEAKTSSNQATTQKKPKTSQQSSRRPSSTSRSSGGSNRKSQSRSRSSSKRGRPRRSSRTRTRVPSELIDFVKSIDTKDKQEGLFLSDKLKEIKRVPVEELYEELKKTRKKISSIVFDGIVTQRLVDLCKEKNIETIVGAKISDLKYRPKKPQVYNFA